MTIHVGQAGSRITANAAAVAVAMGSGTTTAEAQALGKVLSTLADRPDALFRVLTLVNDKQMTEKR